MARECARSFSKATTTTTMSFLSIFITTFPPTACLPLYFFLFESRWLPLRHRRLHKPRDNNEMLSVYETKIPKEEKKREKRFEWNLAKQRPKRSQGFCRWGVKVSIKWIVLSWTHDDKRHILISLFICYFLNIKIFWFFGFLNFITQLNNIFSR